VEQRTGRIEFPEISTRVLEKVFYSGKRSAFVSVADLICFGQVIEYFYYKTQNSSSSCLPEFKIDQVSMHFPYITIPLIPTNQSMALELLVAANFLDSGM
jgi:hypothetical protein